MRLSTNKYVFLSFIVAIVSKVTIYRMWPLIFRLYPYTLQKNYSNDLVWSIISQNICVVYNRLLYTVCLLLVTCFKYNIISI